MAMAIAVALAKAMVMVMVKDTVGDGDGDVKRYFKQYGLGATTELTLVIHGFISKVRQTALLKLHCSFSYTFHFAGINLQSLEDA